MQSAKRWMGLAAVLLLSLWLPVRGAPPSTVYRLPGHDGEPVWVGLAGGDHRVQVVCFLGNECPVAARYAPRLQALADRFHQDGVQFIGVNSNPQDRLEEVAIFAERFSVRFPIAKDFDQTVMKWLGATRTPEVVVLDASGVVRYRGRIDDQYRPGVSRAEPEQSDLQLAIEAVLRGRQPQLPWPPAVGCLIGQRPETALEPAVTYCDQVVRILQRRCVECHRPGEIGPMSLAGYDDVVGWGDMMLEVIDQGRMPPWHADPGHGSFKNERHMLADEIELLREWVAAGLPYGDVSDLPPPLPPAERWRLSQPPDAVFSMRTRPYRVPAEGVVDYQYFVVDIELTEDRWVKAAQVMPGTPAVVHHAIVFIRPPDEHPMDGLGWLAAYVPGQRATVFPPGHARFLPAGSKLVFQMHYTPTGREEEDLTEIALLFEEPEAVTHQVTTIMGIDQDFVIPPQLEDYRVEGWVRRLPASARLLSASPHMHLRGKHFQLEAVPDGAKDGAGEVLLKVPNYDFNWQHTYEWTQPLEASRLGRLKFTVGFDNSPGNPSNPDPTKYVSWGDQTWEEMAVVFLEVARPRGSAAIDLVAAALAGDSEGSAAETESADGSPADRSAAPDRAAASALRRRSEAEAFADDFLARFDTNGDGAVDRSEVPRSFREFGFWRFDGNADRRLDRDELIEANLARRPVR
jgi:peroxiredoxin